MPYDAAYPTGYQAAPQQLGPTGYQNLQHPVPSSGPSDREEREDDTTCEADSEAGKIPVEHLKVRTRTSTCR